MKRSEQVFRSGSIGSGMVETSLRGVGTWIGEATKGSMSTHEEIEENKGRVGEVSVESRPTNR